MSNPKVFEFAKEIGLTPLALMDKIREWQLPVKSHMSELEPEVLEQIKVKLAGGGKSTEEAKPKKATTRKAPAKKAVAPAAEAAPAAAAPAKSTVVRRKATKEAEEAELKAKEEAAAAEEAPKAATKVVRKKAAAPAEEAEETAVEAAPEAPAPEVPAAPAPVVVKKSEPAPEPVVAAAPAEETPAPVAAAPAAAPAAGVARKKEVTVGSSGVASAATAAPSIGRKNIIGRMDLSRVAQQAPQRSQGDRQGGPGGDRQGGFNRGPGGGGGFGGAPRPGQNRNIRAGFIAQAAPEIPTEDQDNRHGRFDDKKKTRFTPAAPSVGPAAAGPSAKEREQEEQMANFNAVEFRKREMVFQPKKKKGMLDRAGMKTQITTPKALKRILKVNNTMKLSDMAMEMGVKAPQLIKVLMTNGVMANMNTALDFDTIALIVPEFGWEAQNVFKTADEVAKEMAFGNLDATTVTRPPVVTIMGHVDHGKTSLLDAIRKANVAAGEAGGITQHIGAYNVTLEDGAKITFLDTPGHEAFTAMRARGANATDIAVIVVAADDGMMPQTAEAINHAKAAGVPIIVAVNKIDKPGANPERIKQQLTELEIVPEEWGGSTIFVEVSALKKTGIKELLENIHLVAELQDLKANPERSGTGLVIEAKMEKGKGNVATILVKDGTVKVGQYIVAGFQKGRVRSLTNDRGERVQEAGPGEPVEVLGLEGTPAAGDRFDIVADEDTATEVSTLRKEQAKKAEVTPASKMSLEDIFAKVTKGDVKELAIVLKADVHGSLEAISGMISKLSTAEVKTRVIHSAVGGVSESDVLLANTAKGIIIGFNVRPDGGAQAAAKRMGVDIRTYSIVYELVDDLKKAMSGLLTPDIVEKVMGRAEVRNTFTVPKVGTIAGCFVVDGKIQRSNMARLIRDGKIVYEGKISSLKRFKDDAKEVATGFECGIGIENFNDVKVGDNIEAFVKEEVARELTYEANV
ncbi:MAG: translation initiation factor IF-2 [Bdellovibrionales bacterium]|nr:translation initiation factor IF-2 [Bdellovibrionales bacterium]